MAHSGIEVLFQVKNFLRLMEDLWTSVWIAGVSLGFGLLLGTFLGVLRTLKNAVLRIVLRLYLEFFRIVPTIVLLFLVYYILRGSFMLRFRLSGWPFWHFRFGFRQNFRTSFAERWNQFRNIKDKPDSRLD